MATCEPAMCLRLRVLCARGVTLHVIMAADGTVLGAIEATPGTCPRWIDGLIQIPPVDVTPSVYRQWKRDMPQPLPPE
jgi:hypothetical protein